MPDALSNERLAQSLADTGRLLEEAFAGLVDTLRLDTNEKRYVIGDEPEFERLATMSFGAQADSFIATHKALAAGGLAVFGDLTQIGRANVGAIPWVVIGDHVTRSGGAAPLLREALGIAATTAATDVSAAVRRKHANVPDWFLTPRMQERLVRQTAFLAGVPLPRPATLIGGAGAVPIPDEDPPRPPAAPPIPQAATDLIGDARRVAECLLNGQWNGVTGSWWGWLFGFEVCMNGECGNRFANLLDITGGAAAFAQMIEKLSAARSIADVGKALTEMTKVGWLVVYAGALAYLIRRVNGPRGICIRGNWPVIGGPGMFVWATAGR